MKYDYQFYLGTHQANWLWNGLARGPMFVAAHRMMRKSEFPEATVPFALDSGGFNHLLKEGRWTVSPQEYAKHAHRIQQETGRMEWAAIQDWVCAPPVLAKTGKTVREHQELTLASWEELRSINPRVPWTPILQGLTKGDYLEHVEMYQKAGTNLEELDVVGIGAVAARQTDPEVLEALEELSTAGVSLHGFGIKIEGIRKAAPFLKSSDSMAWSWHARKTGGDANGQPDAERYRGLLLDEIRKLEEYMSYEGIFEFFGGDE